MTDPGELNRRLVLEAPVESADGAGGVTRSYAAVATLWAAVDAGRRRAASVAADGARRDVTHRIVIRYGADVTHAPSLARRRAHLPHRRAARPRRRGRFLEIDAEERTD